MTPVHRSISTSLVSLGFFLISLISLAAMHASEVTSQVNVIHVPGAAKVVKAKLGADGTIHVLLDTEDGPRYVNSTDEGVAFSSPMVIVDAALQKLGLKFQGEDL